MRRVAAPRKRTRALPRQKASETAEAFLRAGENIVRRYVRRGPVKGKKPIDLLAFVELGDVLDEATELVRRSAVSRGSVPARARVAKLTSGAFYRAFPAPARQQGPRRKGEALAVFRRELGRRLLSVDIYRDDIAKIEAGMPPLERPPTDDELRALVRATAVGDLGRWKDSATDLVFYGLLLHSRDPEVGRWLRAVNDRVLDELAAYWRRWLPRLGRRCRPGLSERHLAVAIRSSLAVLQLEGRVAGSPTLEPVELSAPEPALAGPFPLAALVVEGLFFALTEPLGR